MVIVHWSCGETITSVTIRSSPCAVLVNCPTLLKTPQLPGENIMLWLTCNRLTVTLFFSTGHPDVL